MLLFFCKAIDLTPKDDMLASSPEKETGITFFSKFIIMCSLIGRKIKTEYKNVYDIYKYECDTFQCYIINLFYVISPNFNVIS